MTSRTRISHASATRPVRTGLALLMLATSADAFIGEPETLVYGRIVNRENPNLDQLVTNGDLRWTIQQADGSTIELVGEVDQLDGGNFSYLLRVPHQALMIDQEASPQVLPLGLSATTASSILITLDGGPAGILPPANSVLELDQLKRASALRIDLEVKVPTLDSDGDGLPDWWEDEHGLDKQDGGDALGDLNLNGSNNLAEYLAGTDPSADATEPQLLTREVIAYDGGTSIFLLETADSDSGPNQIVYTLDELPTGGSLRLRNMAALPEATDTELSAGATFTQADLESGQLIYTPSATAAADRFVVSVRDEDPEHPASVGEIQILPYVPTPGMAASGAEESLRLEAQRIVEEHGVLVADLGATAGGHRLAAPSAGLSGSELDQYLTEFGAERPHVLIGGPSNDELRGGAAADFLHGGDGGDVLTGGPGADGFLFTAISAESDEILDFNPDEGDVIDLSGFLQGSSRLLSDYVRIGRAGADAVIEVDADGIGGAYADARIVLRGSPLQAADLADLHFDGNLETGEIVLPPRVSVAVAVDTTSENGPTDGAFAITREGSMDEPLMVGLEFFGTATNGSDFHYIAPVVEIPAGAAGVEMMVHPYVDALVEGDEVLLLRLASSADYLISGSAADASLIIEDLKPQLSLEVIDGIASVDDASPGVLLMRRGGLTNSEVFVRFSLTGTAVNGVDYQSVPSYLTLAAGQTTRVIEFNPEPDVDFAGEESKSIRMTITPDAAYSIPAPSAMVAMVPTELRYEEWLAEEGLSEGVDGSRDELLMRYAFGAANHQLLDRGRMPDASVEEGRLVLSFRRKPAIGDFLYRVQYSNDLETWFTGSEWVEDITAQVAPDDPEAVIYRSVKPISDARAAAMRVQVLSADETSN